MKQGAAVATEAGAALLDLFKGKGTLCDVPTAKRKRKDADPGARRRRKGSEEERNDESLMEALRSKTLGDFNYSEYLALFDKFKALSKKVGAVGRVLEVSETEKSELAQSMGLEDFMDVCRVVCAMNGESFGQREGALVDFFEGQRRTE